jgi:hypothetical protein
MIKSVRFTQPYSEQAVRQVLGAFEKFKSVKIDEISLQFACTPDVEFSITGVGTPDQTVTDNLIKQANAVQDALQPKAITTTK